MKVYFDNAATTPMDEEVITAMLPVMKENFGNPSSVHAFGRKSRAIIEKSRKQVAAFINAAPAEIFFTSGGTEADNMVLRSCTEDLGVTHIITSALEHHAVIDTAEWIENHRDIKLSLVKVDNKGFVDLQHLENLLEEHKNQKTLVSLMHANNEIGTLLPLKKVAQLCHQYRAYFHSDTDINLDHYASEVSD